MPYSEIDLQTSDLDIFFTDGKKLIHLASAGGNLPTVLMGSDTYNESIINSISDKNEEFEIEINPDIQNIDISSFISLARKGFYTYDKSQLGNFQDMTFHLVAKPKNDILLSQLVEKYNIDQLLVSSKDTLPENFESFNLSDYI